MSQTIHPTIAGVFLDRQPPVQPLDFSWRLIRRRQRPFLLLPADARNGSVGLELYSAQRRRAKIWRAAMPLLLQTPAAAFFHRFSFRADAAAEIMRFLAEQSGVAADQLPAPAIKFGGTEDGKSRLVLLVCDPTHRPVKVIKVGVDAGGREATEREADLLEQLPANKLGCIRLTGRLQTPKLSAFATAYFPGDSPEDDAGMEILFHSWINPEPPAPIESLDAWAELETKVADACPGAWATLRAALAGHQIRSTLYHGDFAPWNIRAVNAQNLQAFDWEYGRLRGIPGWDWFHFVVQTSILARRQSVDRVSAEVEELLKSPRFEQYAAATGIGPVVKPLLLAYLLQHRWVIKPLEGARETQALYRRLAEHWRLAPQPQIAIARPAEPREFSGPAAAARRGYWADARRQLGLAWEQLMNVFWEPTLIANSQSSFQGGPRRAGLTALLCALWIMAVADGQYRYTMHLMLLPFYALPCLLASWKIGRRWGMLFAVLGALAGPLVSAAKQPALYPADLVCWNTLMRFIILQMCVFLTDRIHHQKVALRHLLLPGHRPADFAGNWAIVLVSSLWFALVAAGDLYTGPRMVFLPLYLFPTMLITLFLNLRWGALMVLMASLVASADEYLGKLNPNLLEVFGWNFIMRFVILFVVILLLDRLSHENVLFQARHANGRSKAGAAG
jgi:hypothetical protein